MVAGPFKDPVRKDPAPVLSYLLRRLTLVLPVAFGVSVICFLLVQIAPGDPLTSIMPVDASAEQQAEMRAAYGLDKPLPVQYAMWMGKLLQGDMGQSIATGRPVAGEVFGAVQNSLLLALAAAAIAFPVGIFLGFLAGYFRDTILDRGVTALAITGVSLPNYWLGIVLVIVFSVTLGWLPSMGAGPGGSSEWAWDWLHLRHLVLPAVTLSVVPIGLVSRTVRALAGDILSQDFVQALYAKGMSRGDVLRHVARNAAATGAPSAISDGSIPASGGISMAPPVCGTMPAAARPAARCGTEASVRPRSWMLPRAVISMRPLPCSRARSARTRRSCTVKTAATGRRRTSRPSPVDMGAAIDGQAPRRRSLASARAGRSVAVMPRSPPSRRQGGGSGRYP